MSQGDGYIATVRQIVPGANIKEILPSQRFLLCTVPSEYFAIINESIFCRRQA